jgi:hypothetical protein
VGSFLPKRVSSAFPFVLWYFLKSKKPIWAFAKTHINQRESQAAKKGLIAQPYFEVWCEKLLGFSDSFGLFLNRLGLRLGFFGFDRLVERTISASAHADLDHLAIDLNLVFLEIDVPNAAGG